MRVDDRKLPAFGEELSSLVPRQGLSPCVSGLWFDVRGRLMVTSITE